MSFELVAGALVAIKYTNHVDPGTKNATLNIDSTGSKPLYYGAGGGGYEVGYGETYLLAKGASIHVYTGSAYIAGAGVSYRYYDYQD